MLIRDLEVKTGLDRATIRYYEKEGLIEPLRKENGYREYTDENLSHLLKIKLLRQLGMSVYTIKGIQRGSGNFSEALSAQIQNLEHQIKAAQRAREVCAELYQANVSYETLDAAYYLQLLNRQELPQKKAAFREHIRRPYHPVRRFLARMTDYMIPEILIAFLLIVVFRIRPYDGMLANLVSYGTPFLMVPISAWMLSCWGTTPGKWLYGLGVRSEDGCLLHFSEAVDREWQVLKDGYGFGIPIWSLVRMGRSYRKYQDYDPDWDWNSEYQYSAWSTGRKAALATVIAVTGVVVLICASEIVKPRYQGDVTVAEYAANYNFYYGLLNKQVDPEGRMNPDGNWYPEHNSTATATIYIGGEPANHRQAFEFEKDASYVRTIRYHNSWSNVWMIQPVTSKCKVAAITALMSQKGMGFNDLMRFAAELDTADLLDDGRVSFENIEIQWEIETENCIRMGNQYLTASDDEAESQVTVFFEIRVHST